MQGDRERCLHAGMTDYLSKPFTLDQLHAILARWLSQQPVPGATPTVSVSPPSTNTTPPMVQATHHSPPIDQKMLANLRALQREGQPDVLGKVVDIYFSNASKLLGTLREAVTRGDAHTMQQAAHGFKSSSGNVGALTLAGLCKDLEVMGRANCTANAAEVLSAIEAEYGAVRGALETELQRSG
jgi:HPt (histidine-containing phosphotransfer) domain-containing protein